MATWRACLHRLVSCLKYGWGKGEVGLISMRRVEVESASGESIYASRRVVMIVLVISQRVWYRVGAETREAH